MAGRVFGAGGRLPIRHGVGRYGQIHPFAHSSIHSFIHSGARWSRRPRCGGAQSPTAAVWRRGARRGLIRTNPTAECYHQAAPYYI